MSGTRTVPTLTWVCVCCLMKLANDDTSGCDYSCTPDAHPKGLLGDYPDDADLTLGMLRKEHARGCPNRKKKADGTEECECEQITFSRRQCDGCGSHLAGERHAVTMWTEPPRCVVPDVLRGVTMHHSDDIIAVFNGNAGPVYACGFHATYYMSEVNEAHRAQAGVTA